MTHGEKEVVKLKEDAGGIGEGKRGRKSHSVTFRYLCVSICNRWGREKRRRKSLFVNVGYFPSLVCFHLQQVGEREKER